MTERLDYSGKVITPLDEAETRLVVNQLKAEGVTAIAVCTLFSFMNPVQRKGVSVKLSWKSILNVMFPFPLRFFLKFESMNGLPPLRSMPMWSSFGQIFVRNFNQN